MSTATATTWAVDPAHSLAEFSVKHMMITTVKGRFGQVAGTVVGDLNDLAGARFAVTAQTASIDTRDEQRDAHLRSPDFFDAANYPEVTFRSTRVVPAGDNRYSLTGDLTMRGVTREVTFALSFDGQGKDPWGNQRAAFSAETTINRKDWGLNWNAALEAGGFLVGDQVKVAIELQTIRQG